MTHVAFKILFCMAALLALAGAEQYRARMRRLGIMARLVLETHTGEIVASSY